MAPRSVEYPWNQPCQAYQTQLTGSPPIYNQETEGEEVDIKMEIEDDADESDSRFVGTVGGHFFPKNGL